jgi:hypothetical protein
MDVAAWLRGLRLGQYEGSLRAREIEEGEVTTPAAW